MSSASPTPQVRESSVAFVVTSGANVGTRLGRGLTRGGSRVAVLEDTPVGEASDGIGRYLISFASRAQVLHAFDAAAADLGSPQLVVLSALPADLFVPTDSASISPGDWASAVQGAAKITLYCLQAAYAHMVKSGGGTIVCVGPSFALVGAARLLGLSTVLEAQRALVKSAARQWGRHGIRTHWIALGVGENYPTLQTASLPNGPELGPPPPPLGRVPDFEQDVAGIAAFLASSAGRGLTGTSLVADGGDWMVP